ncbi:Cupin domain protein [Sporothrix schenckii 1099-18]|uniref:Cupin domain protein n=1 Tax=Sporothrix schenckii 1099-18 TaxID=1397361 RepID=A0A0F2M1T1_SPOSC|nr:Cupin domain protein [Sporothrix schenckii 1099-18]KJR83662.1 Cupin domain protein [Sporothrix schenckii 1099-18]
MADGASSPPLIRPPTENQLAKDLPGPTVFVTGHADDGTAVLHSRRPVKWATYEEGEMQMSVGWTTASFPCDLSDDRDIAAHDLRMAQGPGATGLVVGGGTVLRYVDFAPGYVCMMHRTVSVDYGIVLEGRVVSELDSGQTAVLERGDVMVQRATMHAWRNPSKTEWARMIFCLQGCEAPRTRDGQVLKEDLGRGTEGIPASGADE